MYPSCTIRKFFVNKWDFFFVYIKLKSMIIENDFYCFVASYVHMLLCYIFAIVIFLRCL
jgi:hypothetical protein